MHHSTKALIATLTALLAMGLAGCDSTDGEGRDGATEGTDGAAAPASPATDRSDGPRALDGADPQVLNAVAPYDARSVSDGEIVRHRLSRRFEEAMVACLAEHGFDEEPSDRPIPDDEAIAGQNRTQFPDIDKLADEGIPYEPADGPHPDELPTSTPDEPPPGGEEAVAACMEEPDVAGAIEDEQLFGSLAGAWSEVLAEIDATDAVTELRGEFSACLEDEGLPPDAAVDEAAFFGHVDRLFMEADGAREEQERIGETYGQIYADCGRELFEARERLRGGQRRDDFLDEHAEALRALTEALAEAP